MALVLRQASVSDRANHNTFSGGTDTVSQGSTTAGQSGMLVEAAVTTAAPVYVNGQTSPLAMDAQGALRVNPFGNQLQNPPLDNGANVISYTNVTTPPLTYSAMAFHGGLFSGTTDAVRRNFSKARTPTVFRTVSTAALGNTVVWTPGAGNKFRLLKFRLQITANASIAVAGVLDITLNDSGTALNLAHSAFVPAAALAGGGVDYDSGWIDLGFFGALSALANNVLNVNLSVALATGVCRVLLAGTEE